jgi:YfiH family protein
LPYLTCSLLQDWEHGFFTQQCHPHPPEILKDALNPQAEVYRVKQVHGNLVLKGGAAHFPPEELPEADGILSQKESQSVWVASADCTPLLLGDQKTGRVAALHAGWRGTAQGIARLAVEEFVAGGSRVEDLYCALGPAIAPEVYQVTEAVAAEVALSLKEIPPTDDLETILAAVKSLENSPLHPDPTPGRVRLDIRQVNYLQLRATGVPEQQIAIAPYCTYQNSEYFFSFRRTREKKVQWSGIVSKN